VDLINERTRQVENYKKIEEIQNSLEVPSILLVLLTVSLSLSSFLLCDRVVRRKQRDWNSLS
jgi:hypothetical protein